MKKNAWNVIFMSFNTNYEATKDDKEDAIYIGRSIFKEDVKSSLFSDSINIQILEFNSDKSNLGKASLFKIEKGNDNKNRIIDDGNIEDFNCHIAKSSAIKSEEDYSKFTEYFNKIYSSHKKDEQYCIIFLAHSFGSGFFPVVTTETNNLAVNKKEYNYLTVKQLAKAIGNVFGEKKIDCFFAINCQVQSIETNYLLRDNIDLLLGSQQPLFVDTIQYKTLLSDMLEQSKYLPQQHICILSTQMLFEKYILDCHRIYGSMSLKEKHPFCLTLTKPENATYILFYLNLTFAAINSSKTNDNHKYIAIASKFCDDPSMNDLINILDANTFFNKLKEIFAYNSKNPFLKTYMEYILKYMNNTILYHLCSGSAYSNTNKKYFTSHYFPNGLGIFVVKTDSNYSRLTLLIYENSGADNGINEDFFIPIKEFSKKIFEEYLLVYNLVNTVISKNVKLKKILNKFKKKSEV